MTQYVDLRFIIDGTELIVGCHHCEETKSIALEDPKTVVNDTMIFVMEHLRVCRR